ncbi:MAG: hypothetical protein KGI59_00820 [Patescibacteria group bacterium]|nr:hypothetical protein [Patescibacteria group bacterium]
MIPESEIVTKKYLSAELSKFGKELKFEILREVRVMMHENLIAVMDNMKEYYRVETDRYIGALMQEHRDEFRAFKDQMKVFGDKLSALQPAV